MKLPNNKPSTHKPGTKPTTKRAVAFVEPQLAVRTGTPVALRLVATSRAECIAAVEAMRRQHGNQVAFSEPHAGRRSGEWLAYGTLFIERGS